LYTKIISYIFFESYQIFGDFKIKSIFISISRLVIILFLSLPFSNVAITENLDETANNILGKYIVGTLGNLGGDYLKHLDIEFNISDKKKIVSSLNAITSFYDGKESVIFNQTTFSRHNGDSTFNTGFAYRTLFSNNTMIMGVNSFYDRELESTHQRIGFGAEFLSSIFDFRGNYYEAFSDTKLNSSSEQEKALDGWDLRGDYHLPDTGIQDLTAFASYYDWSESGGDYTLDGFKVGLTARFYKNLFLEAGIDDNGDLSNSYLIFSYALIFGDEGVKKSTNVSGLMKFQNVDNRMYDKIIRHNRIVKVVKGAVKVSRGN